MALNSLTFLAFLAVVVLVYYIVPKKIQWVVLLVASYGFYLSSGLDHVIFIISTTLFTYGAGRLMQSFRDKQKKEIAAMGDITKEQKRELKKVVAKKVRIVQVVTVLVNLGVLAYVKYLNFFIEGLNDVFSLFAWDASVPMINVIVPLGLSYYTFNTIGYIVDVGRGKHPAERYRC